MAEKVKLTDLLSAQPVQKVKLTDLLEGKKKIVEPTVASQSTSQPSVSEPSVEGSTMPSAQVTTPSTQNGLPPITLDDTSKQVTLEGSTIPPVSKEDILIKDELDRVGTMEGELSKKQDKLRAKENTFGWKAKVANYLKRMIGDEQPQEGVAVETQTIDDPTPIDIYKPIEMDRQMYGINPETGFPVLPENIDPELRKRVFMKNTKEFAEAKKDFEQIKPVLENIKTVGQAKKALGWANQDVSKLATELNEEQKQLDADYTEVRNANKDKLADLGVFDSFTEGIKQTTKANDIADAMLKGDDTELAKMLEHEYMTNVLYGGRKTSEVSQMLGGQVKPLGVTFTAALLSGNPIVAGTAGTAYYARLGAGGEAIQAYIEGRSQGMTQSQALEVSKNQAVSGGLAGGAEGLVGSTLLVSKAIKPLLKFSSPMAKAIVAGAADMGTDATVAMGAQVYKNYKANENGLVRDLSEGVAEEGIAEAAFGLGFQLLFHGAGKIRPVIYNQLVADYAKYPLETIQFAVDDAVKNGTLEYAKAEKVMGDLTETKAALESIPKDIAPEKVVEVLPQVKEINRLEEENKNVVDAFKEINNEKIKKLNGEIKQQFEVGDVVELEPTVTEEKTFTREKQPGEVGGTETFDAEGKKIEPTAPKVEEVKDEEPVEPKAEVTEPEVWVRGTRQANEAGDKFYSSDESIARDYGVEGVGEKPKLEKLSKEELPQNPLRINDKQELSDLIGYKGDPLAESLDAKEKFDTKAKEYAKAKGHDGIIYEEGTMGAKELHVFKTEPTQERVEGKGEATPAAPTEAVTDNTSPVAEVAATPKAVEPITNKKQIGKHFTDLTKNMSRDDVETLLYDWQEAELNEDGTGIKRTGQFRRNAVKGDGGTLKESKTEFINWLNSDAPFDEKVYGKDIRNDTEHVDRVNRAREAAGLKVESTPSVETPAETKVEVSQKETKSATETKVAETQKGEGESIEQSQTILKEADRLWGERNKRKEDIDNRFQNGELNNKEYLSEIEKLDEQFAKENSTYYQFKDGNISPSESVKESAKNLHEKGSKKLLGDLEKGFSDMIEGGSIRANRTSSKPTNEPVTPEVAKEETPKDFQVTTEATTLPDGSDAVKVTITKPNGEKHDAGVMEDFEVKAKTDKIIRGMKLAEMDKTKKPKAEEPVKEEGEWVAPKSTKKEVKNPLIGTQVEFEYEGETVKGKIDKVKDDGSYSVSDKEGYSYTVKAEDAKLNEIDVAKNDFKNALQNWKDITDPNKLGIYKDPKKEAEAMYDIHKSLVRLAKAYIKQFGQDIKKFASSIGISAKQAKQAWDEATGVKKYTPEELDYDVAELTKEAVKRGINVREKFAEYKAKADSISKAISDFINDKDIRASITPANVKSLVDAAANVKTDGQLNKFINFAERVIDNANYAQQVKDIKGLQKKARKINHTGNTKAVKEFTSVNPNNIPVDKIPEYIQALDEITSPVPDYSTMQKIYHEVLSNNPIKDFSNVDTMEKATELYNNIFKNPVESVEDYRNLFSDINGLKRRLKQLVENGDIERADYDAVMEQVGKSTNEVKAKLKDKIDIIKGDLIADIRSKKLDVPNPNKEEQNLINEFKEQKNEDLKRLEPEELWELNELIDRANDGNFDYYRWNEVLTDAEARRRGEKLGEQFKDAKTITPQQAAAQLAKHEAPFLEGVLGLGRSKVGALARFVVEEMERAASDYTEGIRNGLQKFNNFKRGLGKEEMNKVGMIATYLQEYMAQFNPKFKGVEGIGTRDWFGDILSNPDKKIVYEGEKIKGGLFGKNKADVIQKVWDSLPKDSEGKVDVKAIYDSVTKKDGKVLNAKEQAFFDDLMKTMDETIKPKQEASNFARGMDFEALDFYMPRVDLQSRQDIETKVERQGNQVRIKSGFGEERKDQSIRPVETDAEVLFAKALEAANRDYYFGNSIDLVNKTLGYASKAGGSSRQLSNIVAENIKDQMEFEFSRKQGDIASTVGNTILKARAMQTLLDPIRTFFVEMPSTFIQAPLRAGTPSGYIDIVNPFTRKTLSGLLEFTESPLRLRENISKQFDVEQGEIKPRDRMDKAMTWLAGLPERTMMVGAWLPSFKAEFKQLTGENFDSQKFNSDKTYREKYSREIKEAGAVANITTQKIVGVTTKLTQAREIPLPFMEKSRGISKDSGAGKILGFFGNYPRREYTEFVNGFKEVAERLRNGEGIASAGSLSKSLAVALGALTYGYMGSLVYSMKQKYLGNDKEKEKAEEELKRLSSAKGVAEEAGAQALSLAGSKYYSIGRAMFQTALLVGYNQTEDEETKKTMSRLYKNAFYNDPIDPDASKSYNAKDNKEKFMTYIGKYIPQMALAVDKTQQAIEVYGGAEKLYRKYDEVGWDKLTKDEQDLITLSEVMIKSAGIIANVYGKALPMEKTVEMFLRGQKDKTEGAQIPNSQNLNAPTLNQRLTLPGGTLKPQPLKF